MAAEDDAGPSMNRFSSLPESGDQLSKDLVYTILSNARRRYLLKTLLDAQGGLDVKTLVDEVTAREFDESYTYDQRKRIYVSLRQTHLPKLDEADVVDYDADRGRVQPGENFDIVTLPIRVVRNPVGVLLPFGVSDRLLPSVPRLVQPSRGAGAGGRGATETAYHSSRPVRDEALVHGVATVMEAVRLLL